MYIYTEEQGRQYAAGYVFFPAEEHSRINSGGKAVKKSASEIIGLVSMIALIICLLVSCGTFIYDIHTDLERERARERAHQAEIQKAIETYESNHIRVNGRWVPKNTPKPSPANPRTTRKPRKSSVGSYHSSGNNKTYADPVDPDDHDIEGYYEDYRDDFEDIDDAYDAFMDDEDAWDDY